ncbi:MAG: hypothetical protein MJZ20_02760 [Bacteroidaceae bacterium]|nr:hypothetical protein [Bacteroidaceae bacterium]
MATDTRTTKLIINDLTKEQYESIVNPSDTELYLVPDDTDDRLALKQDVLTPGTGITIVDNVISSTGAGGTTNYADLSNKPQIGGVELSGNKTLSALGIAPSTALGGMTLWKGTTAQYNAITTKSANTLYIITE